MAAPPSPFLILLSALLTLLSGPSAVPARAQERFDPAQRPSDTQTQAEAALAAAEVWAAARGLPLHLPQRGGGAAALVGVVDGWPRYLTTLNLTAAQATRTHLLYPGQPLGLALTGRGLTLGMWDSAHARTSHREFGGRVTHGDVTAADDHATHVAGTLVAAGLRPEARGMAYEATLRSYDWKNDATELLNEARGGLLVSNHSYGAIAGWYFGNLEGRGEKWYWSADPKVSDTEDYRFGWYDVDAGAFDEAAYRFPLLLPVVAAGNDRLDVGPTAGTYRALDAQGIWQDVPVATRPRPRDGGDAGFDTIAGAGVAKNVLTVGAIRFDGAGGHAVPSAFSSYGPLDDGRLKPDLVGYGENLFSTLAAGDQSYGWFTGTSMATPNVAGTALLLQQYYRDLTGGFLRGATLKGLLLHTARDLDLAGPDYRTGWGVLDAEAAARHLTGAQENTLAVREGLLADGGVFVRTAYRKQDDTPLRVTLVWADPPSTRLPLRGAASVDDPSPHLRNDLDLRLVDEATGVVYHPFQPDPTAPGTMAPTGDNTRDPVEQVYVARAPAGRYTVRVTHKGRLVGGDAQPFSLLVTGATDDYVPAGVAHVRAEARADAVVLGWQSTFERTAGRFVIERAPVTFGGDAGKEVGRFLGVGSVPAGGTPGAYAFTDSRVPAGRYQYRILFDDGQAQTVLARLDVNLPPPRAYAVLSNYPNPFRGETTLVLDLAGGTPVRLEVFDPLGRRVGVVHDDTLPAGRHLVPLTATGWAPGPYLVRITLRDAVLHHPLLLLD